MDVGPPLLVRGQRSAGDSAASTATAGIVSFLCLFDGDSQVVLTPEEQAEKAQEQLMRSAAAKRQAEMRAKRQLEEQGKREAAGTLPSQVRCSVCLAHCHMRVYAANVTPNVNTKMEPYVDCIHLHLILSLYSPTSRVG